MKGGNRLRAKTPGSGVSGDTAGDQGLASSAVGGFIKGSPPFPRLISMPRKIAVLPSVVVGLVHPLR